LDDQTADLIAALAHDLGKYLTLGLRFLPADATDAGPELVAAVREGLLETSKKQGEVVTAKQIWTQWLETAGKVEAIRQAAAYEELVATVERALAWAEPFDEQRVLEAGSKVRGDLMAVPAAIRRLADELRDA
jgi:hypothetical protein